MGPFPLYYDVFLDLDVRMYSYKYEKIPVRRLNTSIVFVKTRLVSSTVGPIWFFSSKIVLLGHETTTSFHDRTFTNKVSVIPLT